MNHLRKSSVGRPRGWYGPLYFAPEDHRLFVPKRVGWGWGWTFNFGRPWAAVVFVAVLLLPGAVAAAVLALLR